MKNGHRRHRRSFKLHSHVAEKATTGEMAERLAPLEEQGEGRGAQSGANNNGGAIVVDTGSLKLPDGVAEGGAGRGLWLGLEPVVLVITVLALAFIAFVAWRITLMDRKTADPLPVSAQRGG